MRSPRRPVARTLVAVSLLAVGAVSGCSSDPPAAPTPVARDAGSQSLPPGDPGLDAPTAPDPLTEEPLLEPEHGGHGGHDDHDHGRARTVVPAEAFPAVTDLDAFLGGSWEPAGSSDRALPECLVRSTPPVGSAARAWRSDGDTLVVHLATYDDVATAEDVVAATRRQLAGCGARRVSDPRIGSASVAAELGGDRLQVIAAEGVVVTLRATASRVDPVALTTLSDLAMGTSCEAAPDGCH